MTKHIILFPAVNPVSTDRLALDEETRAIQVEFDESGHRDTFELMTRWAVRPLDLLRALRKFKPTLVQFSSDGDRGKPRLGAEASDDTLAKPGAVYDEHLQRLYFRALMALIADVNSSDNRPRHSKNVAECRNRAARRATRRTCCPNERCSCPRAAMTLAAVQG